MKILIAGATGTIGGEALVNCLADPRVTSVVAFTRSRLPKHLSANKKLICVAKEDFGEWPAATLEAVKDAEAMIWALGTPDGDATVNLDYPMAFMSGFVKTRQQRRDSRTAASQHLSRFRFVFLSGQKVEQDHTRTLHLTSAARKIESVFEFEALAFTEEHRRVWQTLIVRPGGVLPKDTIAASVLGLVIGRNWSIRVQELGAFVADLAVQGGKDKTIYENEDILARGRQLLQDRGRPV